MNEILAISLQGMQSDAARVEQIAMNLANVLTPGYKRGVAVQAPLAASFAAHLTGASAALPLQDGGDTTSAVTTFRSDSRPGTLKFTGQSLDVALAAGGYFEVITDKGPAYTRQGNFRVDAAGRLVTAQGYPVIGHGGEIVLPLSNPVITSAGAVLSAEGADEAPLAQLKVVHFEGGATLGRRGEGLLEGGQAMKVLRAEEVQVRQGYLENSNVASTQEMTGLIQAMRHFEAMQKVAQGYDEMLGSAIRKLGENS